MVLLHRIRECLTNNISLSGSIEMDETFIDGKEKNKHASKKQGYRETEVKNCCYGGNITVTETS